MPIWGWILIGLGGVIVFTTIAVICFLQRRKVCIDIWMGFHLNTHVVIGKLENQRPGHRNYTVYLCFKRKIFSNQMRKFIISWALKFRVIGLNRS